jgi:hypothetical protein
MFFIGVLIAIFLITFVGGLVKDLLNAVVVKK